MLDDVKIVVCFVGRFDLKVILVLTNLGTREVGCFQSCFMWTSDKLGRKGDFVFSIFDKFQLRQNLVCIY